MTIVMNQYNEDIQRPLWKALYGHLLDGLLLQIQKLKLDGEAMMVTLDQLLQANEITFQLLTFIPAGIVLLFLFNGFKQILYWTFIKERDSEPLHKLLQHRMRHIQYTLIRSGTMGSVDAEDQNTGKLLLLLDYMEELIERLSSEHRLMFTKDLSILSALNYSPWQKHIVITQMYRTYPFLHPRNKFTLA